MAFEVMQTSDGWPFVVYKHALTRQQHIGILFPPLSFMLDGDSPLAPFVQPSSLSDPMVQMNVSVEVPLLGRAQNVLLDLCTTRIEPRPIGIGVEWKSLPPLVRMRSPLAPVLQLYLRKYDLARHTGRQDKCSPARYRPAACGLRKWCARRTFAFLESDAGTCEP